MKLNKFYFSVFTVVLVATTSCDKEISQSQELKALTPANIDANAGTWKPILLTSNSQIVVAAPADITTPAYKAELQTIKDIQAGLTKAQKNAIEYWSAGGVL